MTKQEVEKFLGQMVAVTFDENDEEYLGVRGTLTKVTDEELELDNNQDELCVWKLSEIQAIEPLSDEWNQPFAWLKDVR